MSQRKDSYKPDPELMRLIKYGFNAIEDGRVSEHDLIVEELFTRLEMVASENPDPDLMLQMEADRCEDAGDWQGAEAAYQQVLDRAILSGTEAGQYKALSDLSYLHRLLDNDIKANELAHAAASAARKAGPSMLLSMACEEQATCALRFGHVADANVAADEALRSVGSGTLHDLRRGRCLVLRARCRTASGDLCSAEGDLDTAWQYLEPWSKSEIAAGAQSALANWWSTKARIEAARGGSSAPESWGQAVKHRRKVAAMPQVMGVYTQNALAETLWAYGEALHSAGRTSQADQVSAEAEAIRKQIGLPPLGARQRRA
jgi:hypothetical protein